MIPKNVDLKPRVPVNCFFEITDACNLRCLHCENSAGRRLKNELSTEEALRVPGALRALGCETVFLTGGEPLMRKDWFQIARKCKTEGLNVRVVTNGIMVDASMVSRLKDAGVDTVCISLDGDEASHNAIRVGPAARHQSVYAAVIGAIQASRAARLKTEVITQINRRNLDDLPRMFEQLVSLDVNLWQLQLCMPLGRLMAHADDYLISPGDIPPLLEVIATFVSAQKMMVSVADNIGYYSPQEPLIRGSFRRQNAFWSGCQAGCRAVSICSDGLVKGCPSHPREFAVGNLRNESFETIWQDAKRFSYNTDWNAKDLVGECAQCPFGAICRAGCTSMAYGVTGTIYDNPFCFRRAGAATKNAESEDAQPPMAV